MFVGSSGVDRVNHVFEVDRLFHLAVGTGGWGSRTHFDVRGVGVVADDTNLGLVGAVVAMQA